MKVGKIIRPFEVCKILERQTAEILATLFNRIIVVIRLAD